MTKEMFLRLMHFPNDWLRLGMYPDELFSWQLSGYQPGHEEGAEHDRNGAFHWWLRREPSREQLKNLLRLAALDPDPLLGHDVRRYIIAATGFDDELIELDKNLFLDPPT